MLSKEEIEEIKRLIGRTPTEKELMLFDALWSEHASYKSSKIHLKKLPTESPRVVSKIGENAGIVKLSDGTLISFKIESHNHPSYIEPYSGAATGVGGIIRDVLCTGARPIALADFLCFGELKNRKTKYLFERVVEGISDYGNSVGVPVVRGQTLFYKFFNNNILVNVMCVGVIPDGISPVSSFPSKKGVVIYAGAKTGRDGIGGASMASESFYLGEEEQKRPTVQIGDPFAEKCLIEAIMEVLSSTQIIAMQDMGAAGFLNSTSEVAAKGGFGVKVDVSRVPKRQPLSPEEVLLSESQERMLIIADEKEAEKIKKIFEKWGLECEVVGELNDTGKYEVYDGDQRIFSIPLDALVSKSPVYNRPMKKPEWIESLREVQLEKLPLPDDPEETFIKVITSPLFASKKFVFEQYDWGVLGQTCSPPGSDAAVIKLHKFRKHDEYEADEYEAEDKNIAIAITIDANPLYTFVDPFVGTEITVLESMRNLTCVGAEPVAITDNMNFGNPENPEIMWEFAESISGMAKALSELNIPVISGNVSFYNETENVSIPPTPVIGMIGEIYPFEGEPIKSYFEPDCYIAAIGEIYPQIASSLYLYVMFDKFGGRIKEPDFALEKKIAEAIREMIRLKLIQSCHDVSDGGIVPAIFESAVYRRYSKEKNMVGVKIKNVFIKGGRWDFSIFSECYPLYIICIKKEKLEQFIYFCNKNKVPYQILGETLEEDIFEVEGLFSFRLSELAKEWEKAIEEEIKR